MSESERIANVFHALSVIKRTVDETRESIDAAIEAVPRDRAIVDELREGILGKGETKPEDLVSFLQLIATSVAELHTTCPTCHLLIGERETLGNALASIRRTLDTIGFEPEARKHNRGKGARGDGGE